MIMVQSVFVYDAPSSGQKGSKIVILGKIAFLIPRSTICRNAVIYVWIVIKIYRNNHQQCSKFDTKFHVNSSTHVNIMFLDARIQWCSNHRISHVSPSRSAKSRLLKKIFSRMIPLYIKLCMFCNNAYKLFVDRGRLMLVQLTWKPLGTC